MRWKNGNEEHVFADNGGLTQTHALPGKSPAIDAGDNGSCEMNAITADQRGQERDDTCDIGAYEFSDDSTFFVIPLANGKAVNIDL